MHSHLMLCCGAVLFSDVRQDRIGARDIKSDGMCSVLAAILIVDPVFRSEAFNAFLLRHRNIVVLPHCSR